MQTRSGAAATHKEEPIVSHFKDQVAIVTGGASGIGRALCEELGQRGARVVVADIDVTGAERVASGITSAGGVACGVHLDVTHEEDVRKLVEKTAAQEGHLDFMFNNAGICVAGEIRDMDLEQWQRLVDVNLWGVVYGTMAAYDVMLEQGFGHIVNAGSADGLIPFPMMAAYSATKHAVIGLSTGLRGEAAGLGVKVSVTCPGLIRTRMQLESTMVSQLRDEDALRRQLLQFPGGMEAPQCARVILRGVERNRGIIVVTAFARINWWLYRLHPALIKPFNNTWVSTIRAHRIE
jgi:NAD(P)-dependent dehydrogenase (short-subunit alcohol dehydrogenase family)